MIKAGPSWGTMDVHGHKNKTEIAEIIISRSETCINFIHFVYAEDGGKKLETSEKIGVDYGGRISLNTIMLDYPHEVITGITGKCQVAVGYNIYRRLMSLTLLTNKSKYGPFEVSKAKASKQVYGVGVVEDIREFGYYVGNKQFGGFFGTCFSEGIECIGIYLKPLDKLPVISANIKTE